MRDSVMQRVGPCKALGYYIRESVLVYASIPRNFSEREMTRSASGPVRSLRPAQ